MLSEGDIALAQASEPLELLNFQQRDSEIPDSRRYVHTDGLVVTVRAPKRSNLPQQGSYEVEALHRGVRLWETQTVFFDEPQEAIEGLVYSLFRVAKCLAVCS